MNLWTVCFKDHHYESFFLLRDSLFCAKHSLDLCVLFKFIIIFVPPDTFRPILALFTHFAYTKFFICIIIITMWNIFVIPDDAVDRSAKAQNLILIFDFRSQRPHLNYILLSNIYSFNFP